MILTEPLSEIASVGYGPNQKSVPITEGFGFLLITSWPGNQSSVLASSDRVALILSLSFRDPVLNILDHRISVLLGNLECS